MGASGGLTLTSGFCDGFGGLGCWLLSGFVVPLSVSTSFFVLDGWGDGSFLGAAETPFHVPLNRLAFRRSANSASVKDRNNKKRTEKETHR